MGEASSNNLSKGHIDKTDTSSKVTPLVDKPDFTHTGPLLEENLLNLHYSKTDLEKTRRFLETGPDSEVISYIEQDGGFVPVYGHKDKAGVITYFPTFAVHGVTNRGETSRLGNIIRDGIKRSAPQRSKMHDASSAPFTDLVDILKRGFAGAGSENVVVYPPNEDTYHTPRHFALLDQDHQAKFLLKFRKFYPSRMGRFVHLKAQSIDRYQPGRSSRDDNVNYAHYVKPEDMSVVVVFDNQFSQEELKAKQLRYSTILSEQVGRNIQVEIVNKPPDYLQIDWDKLHEVLNDQK